MTVEAISPALPALLAWADADPDDRMSPVAQQAFRAGWEAAGRSAEPVPYEQVDHPQLRESDIARFWKYVDKRGPDECWPWTGSRQERRGGYGQLRFGRTILRANRIAFFLANGFWPENALHTCNFPPCCNEAHIYDGTIANNVSDMRDRGRGFDIPPMPGESSPSAKMTRSQAESALMRYRAGGVTMLHLAQENGVTKQAIWRLIHGKSWGELHERTV